jgi:cation transport regulator ChaB
MKYLYISYKDDEKLQTLSAEISWSHNVATYQMVRELPKELKNELPSPEQIARLLENID